MAGWPDVAVGGGIVGGVVAILHALRFLIPSWNNNKENGSHYKKFLGEISQDQRIKDVIMEQRDKEMLKTLRDIQEDVAVATRMLRNLRDITRDIAVSRGITVRYDED